MSKMNHKLSIAIDGPSAAGKSTIAKKISKIYKLIYIDTGAMYRCVALHMINNAIDIKDEQAVINQLKHINIELKSDNRIFLNNKEVTKAIRSNDISLAASNVSSYLAVRSFLVEQQKLMAKNGRVILDGRDIGTVVLPNADLKIYQVAEVKERALRRFKENESNGILIPLDEIEKQLRKRDTDDMNRLHSPLKKACDAIEIDTSGKSINEIVKEISILIDSIIK